MDVQGSQFHLLHGADDWGRCTDPAPGQSLADLWQDALHDIPSAARTDWQYDDALGVLRLHRQTPLFRRAGRATPMDPAGRRGAGHDDYGTWYWIDADRRCISHRPAGAGAASPWWSVDDLAAECPDLAPAPGAFSRADPVPAVELVLQGLTVTRAHYLLAGYLGRAPGEPGGLLVFDLHGGGAPLRLPWPPPVPFVPFDLTDTPDGGVLVLDADHSRYWRLDAELRVRGSRSSHPPLFQPADGPAPAPGAAPSCPPVVVDDLAQAPGWSLTGPDGATPVPATSIEPGPEGTVLVLGTLPADGYSTLSCFEDDRLLWSRPLVDVVEVVDPHDPTATSSLYSLTGYDFCYLAATGPLTAPALYVADAEGDQVVAFTLDPATGDLLPRPDFLPLRRWAGRGLVRAGEGAWYDFGQRWVPLAVFTDCRFAPTATLTTPLADPPVPGPSGQPVGSPGEPFDSQLPGCVWHRLLLDAQVPTGTSITVRARAADDAALVTVQPWLPQPTPYLRTGAGELPWYDAWADRRGPGGALPDDTGTYELLFQHVVGRYVQLELTVRGGGRSSPLIGSARAWYPRFSYPEHYLPAVYVESDAPERFLERFLANFEGLYTSLEEQLEHSHLLLDARTAPEPDLQWLAAFFGLALDQQWTERQRRFLIRGVDRFYRTRGTLAGLVALLRVLLAAPGDGDVFCCPSDGALVGAGVTGVRVVERFLTRGYDADTWQPSSPPPADRVRAAASRFDVFVPADLPAGTVAMIERIVAAAQPAHTRFTLRAYDELFVTGSARLGIDTVLARAPSVRPLRLGDGALGRGSLAYPYPLDLPDRVVIDRDRIGAFPPL